MPRPSLSKLQVEQERRRLSKVALTLFRSKGYEAVSLRKLAAEAGVSYAQPYSYFASKEDLFAHLRADLVNSFSNFIIDSTRSIKNPLARIRRVLHRFVDFVIAHPEEYRLIFSLRQPDPRKYPELFAARQHLMTAMLAAFQEAIDGKLLSGNAAVRAHIAWATVHGLLSLHASNQLVHGYELAALVDPTIDQLFALPKKAAKRKS
jgi:AcrR family transcriptional regulator